MPQLSSPTMSSRAKRLWWRLHAQFGAQLFKLKLLGFKLQNFFSRAPITGTGPIAVSLTSYGARLDSVYLTIESIGRGYVKPARFVLWIDEIDRLEHPPATIRRLARRGLEIRETHNFGPHKKYFPYVQHFAADDLPLATADDDVVYPHYWLSELLSASQTEPTTIHCFRARTVILDEQWFRPYADWPLCKASTAARTTFLTGVSGVVYPRDFLAVLRQQGALFMDCCPRADDVWLNAMALRAGFKVRQIHPEPVEFPELPGSQSSALWMTNQFGDGNDAQIRATYVQADILRLKAHGD